MADDGRQTLDERVCAQDLANSHFQRCLAERIQWAVEDAQEWAAPDRPALVTAAA